MNEFLASLSGRAALGEPAGQALSQALQVKTWKKGETILAQGQVCRHAYFVESGLLKLCFENGQKDFVLRFFAEGSMCTELESFTTLLPSRYAIIALEPVVLHCIGHAAMEQLCSEHHVIETAFRRFLSLASRNMIGRISEMLEEDATARYQNFVQANIPLLQRISLGDLASYLGITQMSLSRIRSKR